MSTRSFYFHGEPESNAVEVDISNLSDLAGLKHALGTNLGVVKPEGLSFHSIDGELAELSDVKTAQGSISMRIDGHPIREVPGPQGLPGVGSYFEIFPDHLGDNQRLFEEYGRIFQTATMGATNYYTNDPELAHICFNDGEWFSKQIIPGHPLYPLKTPEAGVFLADTSDPSWKAVHKFLPPALGPKAVRHYASTMNQCIDDAFPIFDKLEEQAQAWNTYQYMLKLSSGTVGKIMLGKDFGHFESIDAPLHKLVLAMAEMLAINKKIATRGQWYSYLPFGDPKRLKNLQAYYHEEIDAAIKASKSTGTEDLPLQDAALKAANVIDYLVRATDSSGQQLPKMNLIAATQVATGAGFTTTSSLLSWCLYSLVTYPNTQARLLQELVNHGIKDSDSITADQIDDLPELDKFVKEVQRVHNPSYQPGRTAQRDMILPGGYRMKQGSVVIIALHHIHHNPNIWEKADRFDMDRWDTDAVKNRPKDSYIPFAAGQRMCIGFNFALLEVKIFVAKLVYRYHWSKEGDVDTEYDPFFQLIRPVNLYVRTQRREVWPSVSV